MGQITYVTFHEFNIPLLKLACMENDTNPFI